MGQQQPPLAALQRAQRHAPDADTFSDRRSAGEQLVAHRLADDAADETTGQAVVAYVILKQRFSTLEDAAGTLRGHVATSIGAIARPRQVFIVTELPKTRSGKIMRRLLRDVAEGRPIGDTTTLADPAVMRLIEDLSGSPATTSITTGL